MPKTLIIMLANGLEEVEFSLPYDLCYRAGIKITLVAVPDPSSKLLPDKLLICGSHELELRAHCTLEDFLQQYHSQQIPVDAVFLPGGMPGSRHLGENQQLTEFLLHYSQTLLPEQRYLAAICAAPAHVLGKACGLLNGKKYTCYPGAEAVVPKESKAQKQDASLVEDSNMITASGVGSAHLLAERLIERLAGETVATEVMKAVLYR